MPAAERRWSAADRPTAINASFADRPPTTIKITPTVVVAYELYTNLRLRKSSETVRNLYDGYGTSWNFTNFMFYWCSLITA